MVLKAQINRLIKRLFRRFLIRNYYLAKLGYNHLFYRNSRNKRLLLVYQMGKVGSSTIKKSLDAYPLDMPIYQVHHLTAESIEKDEKFYYGRSNKFFRKSLLPTTEHLFISHHLRYRIKHGGLNTQKKWRIVTLVREPIARNISGFFEHITFRIPNFYERYRANSISIDELIQAFLDRYEFHEVPLTWFDAELKATFDIDVFSSDFPKSTGYKIYEGLQADILLLRLESIKSCAPVAFKDFLNIDNFTLISANVSEGKDYYSAYQRFLDSVVLPPFYIDKMYESRYAKHFYTQDEINLFRAKWSKSSNFSSYM